MTETQSHRTSRPNRNGSFSARSLDLVDKLIWAREKHNTLNFQYQLLPMQDVKLSRSVRKYIGPTHVFRLHDSIFNPFKVFKTIF